jgi:anti-sigma regulatory factor (Ser/Thr protein kinase)
LNGPLNHPGGGLSSAEIVDGRLRLVLNNCIAAVEEGQSEISAFLAGHVHDAKVLHRIGVLYEELVSNIIRHGFVRDSRQSIHVSVAHKPGIVEMIFEDDGVPFNPLEAPPPEPFSSLENARIGGLGISLVVKLASDLSYERLEPAAGGGFAPRNRMVVRVAF